MNFSVPGIGPVLSGTDSELHPDTLAMYISLVTKLGTDELEVT